MENIIWPGWGGYQISMTKREMLKIMYFFTIYRISSSSSSQYILLLLLSILLIVVYVLEKAMAPHSSTLAWKIPWTKEPGKLQSMKSLRVGHDWETSLSLFTFMHWRRKWQPTPVFLPGESQGWGSLVGGRLWGRTESDTTEVTWRQQQQHAEIKMTVEWRS